MAYSHDRSKIYLFFKKYGPAVFKDYMREHLKDYIFFNIALRILIEDSTYFK